MCVLQKTAHGMKLDYCNIRSIVKQLRQSSSFDARKQQILQFNKVGVPASQPSGHHNPQIKMIWKKIPTVHPPKKKKIFFFF